MNTNDEKVKLEAEFQIHEGRESEAERIRQDLIQRGIESAKLTINSTTGKINCVLSADDSKLLGHAVSILGPDIERLDQHAKLVRLECFGEFSDLLKHSLDKFGARYLPHPLAS